MTYKTKIIRRDAWNSLKGVLQELEQSAPHNADIVRFRSDVAKLYATGVQQASVKMDGLRVTINGTAYNLGNPQGLGSTLDQDITDLINMSADEANAYVKQTELQMKAATNAVVNSVGGTLATAANVIPVIGQVVSAIIAVVTLAVSLYVMFGWNPCEGAYYVADDIRYKLQREFAPSYIRVAKEIEKNFATGALPYLEGNFNELLKQIDLGVYHYELESRTHSGNKCSVVALHGFTNFVNTIKNHTNHFYSMVETAVKDFYKFVEIETEGYLSERSWYFIVPVLNHKGQRAKYRKIRLERWNENLKSMYPYGDERGFDVWLEGNVRYFKNVYNDDRGERYRKEMLPFKDKIKSIRDNLYVNVAGRHWQEDILRKEQFEIYLRYDTDYAKSLEKISKSQIEAYNMANASFLKELNKVREEQLKREKGRLDNVMKIASDNADRKAGILQKNLLLVGGLAVAGIFIIREINH